MQAILRHAFHVLLDDGFQLALHLGLLGELALQVVAHQRILQRIDGTGLLTIELQHMVIFDVLVDTIEIVDCPGILSRGVEQVDTKAEVGLGVVKYAHNGRQDINLLGYFVLYLWLAIDIARLVYDDG